MGSYYYSDYDVATLGAVIAAFAMIFVIAFFIWIPFYVLRSLGLYNMAKNRGMSNPWIAWIPFVSNYLIGEMVNPVQLGSVTIQNCGLILALSPIIGGVAGFVLSFIPIIGWLLLTVISIGLSVFLFMCHYYLYKQYEPDNAVLYIVLTVLFSGVADAIIFFKMRNMTPSTPVRHADYDGGNGPRNNF